MTIKTIIETIDDWGKDKPDRIAYQNKKDKHTYGELKRFSDSLACYLEGQSMDHGPVVVFGNLEFEMIAAFLGVVKSGRAYLPIEEHTPKERIESILRVAQPSMIISIGQWVEEDPIIPVVSKEELHAIFEDRVASRPQSAVKEDENFYIIFTSGTTGEPKGVQISHENLKSFVRWTLEEFKLGTGKRFLAQAPFSFDLSVFSIYPALLSGGSLVPLEKSVIQDFRQLFSVLPKLELDVWVSTPSFMEICLMEPTFDAAHVPELATFLFCGEELTKKTAQELLKRFPDAAIYNTYGPTEATVAISSIQITPQLLDQYERLPIGYIKSDTKVHIAYEDKDSLTDGTGEIIISGPSVSKGYLNNPEKTQAAFFEQAGKRSYRTGDAGRMSEDGLLFYEGRIDQQIKLHGYRIELGDIEHYLLKDDRIKQAVVVPRYQKTKVQQLVAFIVLENSEIQPDFKLSKSIKEVLSQYVMDYMIPQKINYAEMLPQTVNGKIDRKKLLAEVNAR
ncbi:MULTISPECIES: D-alanine--poly(phosphoribitol) ligase subunit DltA [unclassified Enterococcus]|uniref:D-alanine--poly(phosphoribitol) ligase subunit DltA n=1 Tax=unclassified Enterococcus TaxID=2608891 RepID=UPI0013ECBFD1|nr:MULTISPECIES: D-alanine--poly(phosphoribitol) ligase subunit DltA [unclassified Enterococcus]